MFNWRHLARVLVGLGDEDGAEEALQRAVALARSGIVSPLTAMTGSLAWADLVTLRHQRGDDVTGLLAEGRARWPEQWQLVWIEGQIHLDRGRLEQAAACFRALLEVDLDTLPEAGVSYDQRVFGVFAQSSLGLTLFRMGRYAEAAEAYAAAERLEPDEREHTAKRILAERRAASRIAQAR
jgi:tetratricopeptide (TPR) repeat protein